MKPEEAKKYLKFYAGDGLMKYVLTPIRTEALISAIEALDKQVPKKPEYDGHTFACPTCKTIFLFKTGEIKGFRCKWCGQAIDWEEIKNDHN